jgi:hypothetical protein
MQRIVYALEAGSDSPLADYGIAIVPPSELPDGSPVYWLAAESNLPYRTIPSAVVAQVRHANDAVVDFASLPYPTVASQRAAGLLYAAQF